MDVLKVINKKENVPTDYVTRITVKAIVTDGAGRTAVFSGLLLGGGVEEGETTEQALHRECMEESGIKIEIVKSLGIVVQYRDELKRKYEVHGFLARLTGEQGAPTTKQEDELGRVTEWLSVDEARRMFEEKISELKDIKGQDFTKDIYQGKLYNTMTALLFLEEATK